MYMFVQINRVMIEHCLLDVYQINLKVKHQHILDAEV